MRTILFPLFLLFTIALTSQESSSGLKEALMNDDAKSFKNFVNADNIDTCYEMGNSSYSLIHLTIKFNSESCFKELVSMKANLNVTCSGKTPLMYAAKYGRLEMAKILVSNKADVNFSYKGRSAKDYAIRYQKDDIFQFLNNL